MAATILKLIPAEPPKTEPSVVPSETRERFPPLYTVRAVGNCVVGSLHHSRFSLAEPDRIVRLHPQDSNNGQLLWINDRGELEVLEELLQRSELEGSGWSYVPDWCVAPSGRIFFIGGQHEVRTPSRYWSAGRLYSLDLSTREVGSVYSPDAKKDALLFACHALGEEDILLLALRRLFWIRRGDTAQGWSEVASARFANGRQLVVGDVAGQVVAITRTVDPKTGVSKTFFFCPAKDKLKKTGQVVERDVVDVRIVDSVAYLQLRSSGWHAIESSC